MLKLFSLGCFTRRSTHQSRTTIPIRHFHTTHRLQDEQLKILFCGSDDFSATSLIALRKYQQSSDSNISSIDVVTRTDKRTGRGLKKLTSPPIKQVATEYGLPVQQIDTFKGWTPPDINLIIAVSFGLLIPPRIINGSKYGGLNVHPSLLPDLRGAAPIPWAVAYGRSHTGVSIQTLHPSKFDHGVVLKQTDEIEISSDARTSDLTASLAPIAASLLVEAMKERSYLLASKAITILDGLVEPAPKIKTEHSAISFSTMTAADIHRRYRALGMLHAFVEINGQKQRVKFATDGGTGTTPASVSIGVPYGYFKHTTNWSQSHKSLKLQVNTVDGNAITLSEMLIEGKPKSPAAIAAVRAHLMEKNPAGRGMDLYTFKSPLTAT